MHLKTHIGELKLNEIDKTSSTLRFLKVLPIILEDWTR